MARDLDKIQALYGQIMTELGIICTEDNVNTPTRVAKALLEMTENIDRPISELVSQCTTFENKNMAITLEQDGIEFASMCSHHHLPFMGKVKITYTPNERIIGLSKFKRITDFFARKPQVQEDFTEEIGNFLVHHLNPINVKVEVYDCLHTCMCARGVRSASTTKTTFEWSGY